MPWHRHKRGIVFPPIIAGDWKPSFVQIFQSLALPAPPGLPRESFQRWQRQKPRRWRESVKNIARPLAVANARIWKHPYQKGIAFTRSNEGKPSWALDCFTIPAVQQSTCLVLGSWPARSRASIGRGTRRASLRHCPLRPSEGHRWIPPRQ